MGDSTAMTIEFLRARLLSERSVSRTARLRADQLTKRVLELEEQLRIVTIQRKKAEKAAAEVLAILESQGIGDLSEAIDSSTDQEEVLCGKGCDGTLKEDESSTASRMERSEVDDGLSGFEAEVLHSHGRSLYWKSERDDKKKAKQIRQRRRNFMPASRTSKHHLGKSCRKINRKDMGSAEDGLMHKPNRFDTLGSGEFTCCNYSDDQPEVSMEASRGMMEKATADVIVSDYADDSNEKIEPYHNAKDSARDEEMEKALEQQAKLIDQFQAEENAQREWEEKYNETMIPTLAYYEPGNQSSIPENRSQSKEEARELTKRILDNDKDGKKRGIHIPNTRQSVADSSSSSEKNSRSNDSPNAVLSSGSASGDLNALRIGKYSNAWRNESSETKTAGQNSQIPSTDHSVAIRNENQNGTVQLADSKHGPPSSSRLHPDRKKVPKDASPETRFPVDERSNKLKEVQPLQENGIELQKAQPPQAPSSHVGGVLEALQRAKLSLAQELSKLPSRSQGTLALAPGPNPQTRGYDVSFGSSGLFRLPTDSFPSFDLSGPRYYSSGLDLTTSQSDAEYTVQPNSFRDLVSSTSYRKNAPSRVLPRFDNYFSPSMLDSVSYSRAYSDLSAERFPLFNEFSRSRSDVRNGVPPGGLYSPYGGDRTTYSSDHMRML